MIVSASYRTDVPGFYTPWFERRYRAGYCLVAHPFDQSLKRVGLNPPEVDGYVFWTRNVAPFLPMLRRLANDDVPFVVQYTITGYPRSLEAAVAAPERAVGLCHELADTFGGSVAVWRYDPILLTTLTEADFHRRQFEHLAGRLAGATDEVVVSFAQMYRKAETNLRKLRAGVEGFDYHDPDPAWKRAFLLDLRELAAGCGMRLSVCAQRELLQRGLHDAACVDPARLGRVAGRPVVAARKPHRTACGCWESVDIGAYDTCPSGCVYCYANRSRELADRRRREHRVEDLLLWRPRALRHLSADQLLARAAGRPDPHAGQLTLFDDV